MEELGGRRALLEYDFSADQLLALEIIYWTLSSFSFLGGLFVVVSFCSFKRLRNRFAFEQVTNMALADMGACATYWVGHTNNNALCQAQAMLQQTFELSSVLWASVIATTLHLALRNRESRSETSFRHRAYAYAWGIPVVLSLLPFSTNSYGSAGAWCWIRPKPRDLSNAWRFSVFYAPVWIIIIYNAAIYARCAWVLGRLTTIAEDETAARLKQTIKRLIRYPLILMLCWTIPTVNRLQQLGNNDPIFALYVLTSIARSLIGLLNALAFGATENVRAEWRGVLRHRHVRCGGFFAVLDSSEAAQAAATNPVLAATLSPKPTSAAQNQKSSSSIELSHSSSAKAADVEQRILPEDSSPHSEHSEYPEIST